jgi:hypothetical protein
VKRVLSGALALGVVASALGWALPASAYCFTSTCKNVPICDGPAETLGQCIPLRWRTGCAGFTVYSGGSPKLGYSSETVTLIADLAFEAWRNVDCGNGGPGLSVIDMGTAECDVAQYNKDAGNTNVIVFRDGEWPNPDTGHNIALTTTTFDPDTGELLDADIELNSAGYALTVSDESVDFDLLSVLTHEAGHFLGLAHSELPEATMYASYQGETIDLRTPEPDDVTAICTLYPHDDSVGETCNPLPRHGFSPYCRDDQPEGSCATSPRDAGGGAVTFALSLIGAAAVHRAARRALTRARTAGRSPSRSPGR